MLILILLGIITLVGVVFLAISRKSSPKIRITALCALALMVLTIIVCLLIIFGVISTGVKPVVLPDAELFDTPPAPSSNFLPLVMLIIFLVVLFVLVLVLSMREQWRGAEEPVKDDW